VASRFSQSGSRPVSAFDNRGPAVPDAQFGQLDSER
jgi:hypothetical protein